MTSLNVQQLNQKERTHPINGSHKWLTDTAEVVAAIIHYDAEQGQL